MAPHIRAHINRSLLDELRVITIEQTENLYPLEEEMPTWQPGAPISDPVSSIINDLLLEILAGKISLQTLTVIDGLSDLNDIPQPYRELISLVQGSREDGQEIAGSLLYNLSAVIEQMKKMKR